MNGRLFGASAIAVAMAAALSACGGGGSGVAPLPYAPTPNPTPAPAPTPTPTPTPSPTPSPTSTNYDTAEYQNSDYAVAADAISAYDAGASGKGIKVGIVDSGINPSLSEFAGRIDPASGDVYGTRGVSDQGGHGTAVSAVAAAARNNQNTMGAAWNATIVSERADDPGSCSQKDGCQFYDSAIAEGIDAARQAGARVINLSLGGSTPGQTLLTAMQQAVNAGIVLVIAAGNDSTANPDPFALLPAQDFPGMVIIAGSVGDDNGSGGTNLDVLSSFSDKAGAGASSYLAALGYQDRAPDENGTQYIWDGTSFSAPTISGAVALMAQAFPNLTGKQIVSILFQSADDLGAKGIDSVFGNGRLDIARAFQPIGATTMADSETPVSTSDNGSLPRAAGDGAATGQSFGAIVLDGYSRAFVLNLAKTLHAAPADHPLADAIRANVRVSGASAGPVTVAMTVAENPDLPHGFAVQRFGIGPEDARKSRVIAGEAIAHLDKNTAAAFGMGESAKALERRLADAEPGAFLIARDIAGDPGFAAVRGTSMAARHEFGPVALTMSAESGNVWTDMPTDATGSPYRLTRIAVDKRFGRNWLYAGVSRLDEKDTLLGGRMAGPLAGGGSSSIFADLEARHDFGGGLGVAVTARHGWTAFAAGKLQTDAYAFDVAKAGLLSSDDRLGLRISQPLRVESGGFGMMLPTSYSYSSGLATDSWQTYSLAPSGREVDAELSYGASLWDSNGWVGGNLFARRNPGHVASAPNDYGGAIRFTVGLP